MRHNDETFDALLTAACADAREADLAALEALTPDPAAGDAPLTTGKPASVPARRPIVKTWKGILAAALTLMLATGVYAVWPSLRMELQDGIGRLVTEDAPKEVQMERMSFPVLPEGYELTWLDEDAEDGLCSAAVQYRAAATTRTGRKTTVERGFTVTQCALTDTIATYVGADGSPMDEETWEEVKDSYWLLDSAEELTEETLHSKKILRWTDGNCLYTFRWEIPADAYSGSVLCEDAPDYRNDARYREIIGILQGITTEGAEG